LNMTVDSTDDVDLAILEALQRDGRLSYAELGRSVSMSASAVTERVRRLEEIGAITGYAAVVDPERLGLGILAFVRLRYPISNYKPFHDLVAVVPEIVEAHHVTGEDCFILKVVARSMRHLEQTTGRISTLGAVTTTVVYSSPLKNRPLALRSLQ
jgi:Lrp/AsnC family leucine-responsive transcriptional regulator